MPMPAASSTGLPRGCSDVAEHYTFDQGNTDGDGEGDGETDDLNARDEERISDIEDESAERGVEEVEAVGRMQIGEKCGWGLQRSCPW